MTVPAEAGDVPDAGALSCETKRKMSKWRGAHSVMLERWWSLRPVIASWPKMAEVLLLVEIPTLFKYLQIPKHLQKL